LAAQFHYNRLLDWPLAALFEVPITPHNLNKRGIQNDGGCKG
jgi:hypothetical protein